MTPHAQCSTRYGGSLSSIKSVIQHFHEHGSQEEVIIFRCVSPDIADNIFNWIEGRGRFVLSYYPEEFEMVVCIPGIHHETASLRFAKRIEDALRPHGLDDSIIPTGSTTFRPSNAVQKRAGKQADAGFKSPIKINASDIPNIIIETALSQSYPSAARAAQYWLKVLGVSCFIPSIPLILFPKFFCRSQ